MDIDDLKGLRYFILYAVIVIGFFFYSGIVGWNWFNTTATESTRPTGRTGHVYRYHK